MKITINLTKEEREHLINCDYYIDTCGTVSNIINKVKKASKILRKEKSQ